MLVPIAVLAAVAGVALLALGLRGRRVDDHPLCRRCGYDLTGTPADRCPECGRDLSAARSTKTGHRRRRPGLVAGGLALLLPSLAVLAAIAYVAASGVDVQGYKPQLLLRMESRSSDPATADAAAAELARRYDDDGLSPASVAALVDAVLAKQADPSRPWDEEAEGVLVERMRFRGDVTDGQWADFIVNGSDMSIEARSAVRRGDPVVTGLDLGIWSRGGPNTGVEAAVRIESLTLGGVPIDHREDLPRLTFGAYTGFTTYLSGDGESPAGLPLGDREIVLVVRVDFWHNAGVRRHQADLPAGDPQGPPLASRRVRLTAPVRVLPETAPPPFLTVDPALGQAVRAGVAVSPLWPTEWTYFGSTGSPASFKVLFPGEAPVVVTPTFEARPAGSDEPFVALPSFLPAVSFGADAALGMTVVVDLARLRQPNGLPAAVDLRVVPDADAAARSLSVDNPTWGEAFVIPGVPVVPARPDDPLPLFTADRRFDGRDELRRSLEEDE